MSLRNKIRKIVTELEIDKPKISYSAVVLDTLSRKKLLNIVDKMIPEGWEVVAHHMTICLGELPEDLKPFLGHSVSLYITDIGMSDKAFAVKVEGFDSEKENPHITIAVNRKDGGKPKDSDSIERWSEMGGNIMLRGNVDEIPHEKKEELDESKKKKLTESMSIKDINELPFKDAVLKAGGQIYSVGGAVRDGFLGKESKDLDVLIAKIPIDRLMSILRPFSDKEVKEVGESYGIIKFVPKGSKEEIDIAIPRKERKTIAGHTGFEFSPDHNLPVEQELERRDFTINAIAKSHDGKIIDPFNGIEDLKNKIIRVIGEKSFSDDPLRMLRGVQFASRFGFEIEPVTTEMIKKNAHLIKEISPERILIEFEKMIFKGDVLYGIQLLVNLGLFKEIFGFNFLGDYKTFSKVKDMSDFIYLCFQGQNQKPSVVYKNKFKGNLDVEKQLEALEMMKNITEEIADDRLVVSKMLSKSPNIKSSNLINSYIRMIIENFENGTYPKSINELDIDGNDLMSMGLKGKDIGLMLVKIFKAVLSDKLLNNKSDIIEFIQKPEDDMISEEEKQGKITKLTFFDFDGTLANSPTPENGREKYKEITGKEYPHQGWWGKPESLETFDVQLHTSTLEFYKKSKSNPNNKTILLTNRIPKLSGIVKKILEKNNLSFDEYSFKSGKEGKVERIEKFMHQYPDATTIEIHDDQDDQLIPLSQWADKLVESKPEMNILIYDAKDHIFKM